ncbi:uncharacterized protein LOC129776781 [Toxorhynchites rutilus septentrionalis]|uniref:uncharacterized protein LOC129776781 n=1 Tax=Toxorhynchites rutilus septentrionalis TaxID=329112 RepID=UPI00247A71DF|nr:uncharacterized protein LOC129776781 [Toxorhynchites rutilus septentrionalis]
MAVIAPSIYAAIVTCVGFACFALSATAVGLPVWARFRSYGGFEDYGYFGPWKVCRQLVYSYREKCGPEVSHFRPPNTIFVAGLLACFACISFGMYCIFCILQIAMISSREKVVLRYTTLVALKLSLALVGAVLALIAAIVFGVTADNSRGQFEVTRGVSFHVQLVVVVLSICLVLLAVYDMILSRQTDGDPTMLPTVSNGRCTPTTVVNPGYRDTPRGRGSRVGISVTDSSGRPYTGSSATVSGSVQSMSTTVTSMSGSTASTTRTPLRSSLKKPRPPEGTDALGIQNPGYSGSGQSPRLSRNGSVKKVRIQTHDTEV